MDIQAHFSIGKSLGLANNRGAIPDYLDNIETFKKQAEQEVRNASEAMRNVAKLSVQQYEQGRQKVFGNLDEIMAKTEKMLTLLLEYGKKFNQEDLRTKKLAEMAMEMAEKNFQLQLKELQTTSPSLEAKMAEAMLNIDRYIDNFSRKLSAYAEAIMKANTEVTELHRGFFQGTALSETIQ